MVTARARQLLHRMRPAAQKVYTAALRVLQSSFTESILVSDQLVIAGRAFSSRLIVGTGKYRGFQEMARAHAASGAEMVTVAVRRVNLTDKSKESLLDYIPRDKMFILPNTAACYTADEAIRTRASPAKSAFRIGSSSKFIGDQQTLFPTQNSSSKPRAFWSRRVSSFFLIPTTI